MLYLFDSAAEAPKREPFENIMFGNEEVGVTLRCFHCARIVLSSLSGFGLRPRNIPATLIHESGTCPRLLNTSGALWIETFLCEAIARTIPYRRSSGSPQGVKEVKLPQGVTQNALLFFIGNSRSSFDKVPAVVWRFNFLTLTS